MNAECIYVLAGSQTEFKNFQHNANHIIQNKTLEYVHDSVVLRGITEPWYIILEQFWDRKDASEIYACLGAGNGVLHPMQAWITVTLADQIKYLKARLMALETNINVTTEPIFSVEPEPTQPVTVTKPGRFKIIRVEDVR
jgi:hypothetical protein